MVRKNVKLFSLILLTSVLTSCGAFRSVFKSKDKTKENTEVVIDKKETTKTEDKSTTIIEEKIDTNILVPSKTVVGISKPISNLLDIQNLTLVSDGLYTVKQTYDSLSKSLKTTLDIDSHYLNVNKNKKTTINNNINTTKESKDNSKFKQEVKTKVTKKEVEGKNSIWVVVLVIGVVSVFAYFTYRYFKK